MPHSSKHSYCRHTALMVCGLALSFAIQPLAAANVSASSPAPATAAVTGARQINPTTVEILLAEQKQMTVDFYADHIFRLFRDDTGGIIRNPESQPPAQILVDSPRKAVSKLEVKQNDNTISLTTTRIRIDINRQTGLFQVIRLADNSVIIDQAEPVSLEPKKVELTFKTQQDEYFYGGGVQNGRFSHKGKVIAIENQNSWTDGGVASPAPFYWSTKGYGLMWHTFKKGAYDFGSQDNTLVRLRHETNYLDVFLMVGNDAIGLLNSFYQLTGHPVLLPKFAFYQGHLNAYNRDYWKPDEKGILFEDGKRYKESSKQEEGAIPESLNGELNNYQFSARAVIDRYKQHDMPLGWLLPNDGYGAGYGQTKTLDGNIANLRNLTEYAQQHGVEIGLWTQSDLHPKEGVEVKLQRDIVKEVRDAGVRVLKTDVAWVGAGYSFGLNGITDVAQIMTYYGNNARPFIISLDGWAGTQRYAGIWSGDQTGGEWEYIRFHIPTYIGSGLSGQPNISSDMDGIFGGKKPIINTRDFQWKTFSPMELNMDGWGANEKYPHAMGEPYTSINRFYLKLKSQLLPYTYSIAHEAVSGMPIIRAMFLDSPNPYSLGSATRYQFLYGPNFLIAPIYQETRADKQGNDVRHGIYIPEGQWIDYFTGEIYEGGRIYNDFAAPIWKLPVFVRHGAIIPMTNPNNNVSEIRKDLRIYEIYPCGKSTFTEYDDDGISEEYKQGHYVTTKIESVTQNGNALVTIHPTQGQYPTFQKLKGTEFRINVTDKPKNLAVRLGGQPVQLKECKTLQEFLSGNNVYFYNERPNLNQFSTAGSEFAKVEMIKNPMVLVKLAPSDITKHKTVLLIEGFEFQPPQTKASHSGQLTAPAHAQVKEEGRAPYALTPSWDAVPNADYYEIHFDNMLYTTIQGTSFTFEDLEAETPYSFRLRAVNKDGASDWVSFQAVTKDNPLEFAIPGIQGKTSVENQGNSLTKLFDFKEKDTWHTKYSTEATPFDLTMDLVTVNKLDRFVYVPREDAGNGTILKGEVSVSMDQENWTTVGSFEWAKDASVKEFTFKDQPTARFIRLKVAEGVGKYGSGRELYVFKVPGTASYLPGDINNDGKIDRNDLTSYTNYTGLRKGDADFEGYISNGDINKNNLIDAYDISLVATRLEVPEENKDQKNEEAKKDDQSPTKLGGSLELRPDKQDYKNGEIIEITVRGNHLALVNALSFALPYQPADYEYVGIAPLNMGKMANLTNDRLHSNGNKALYPTFVNIGLGQSALQGSQDLFIIRFKAKKDLHFNLKAIDGILVDQDLHTKKF